MFKVLIWLKSKLNSQQKTEALFFLQKRNHIFWIMEQTNGILELLDKVKFLHIAAPMVRYSRYVQVGMMIVFKHTDYLNQVSLLGYCVENGDVT